MYKQTTEHVESIRIKRGCAYFDTPSLFLEIIAEAYLQSHAGKVLEVVQAHVGIDCRLDADMIVQVEAIANLGRQIDIVGA